VAPYAAASVQQLRAELLLARARAVEGERAVAATLASFATFPAPADVAAAALEFARVATRAGIASRTPVPEWLRQAAAGFERLGDHAQRERALARAVDWYRRHAEHGPVGAHDRNLLEAVTRLLDLQPDLDELARRAMQLAVDQLDAERGVLVLASDDAGELRPVVEYGAMDASTRDQALTYSREAVERVATSGGSLLMADTATESETLSKSMVELGLRSILCVPMFVAGKVVGAVYLDDSRRAEAFGDAERGLLEGFAHLMAVAIENRRGHDRVRRANEELLGENLSLRRVAGARFQPSNFVARSLVMQRVLGVAERAASLSSTVLITGENGTGKEQVARMLHYSGSRSLKPFVAVNCGAIPETLLESELFGILPDVATGVRARAGRFVEAHQGTLFLDEIGEMPPSQQVALLGVLSNRKLTPVGGGRPVDVDVRVIAATNADLAKLVSEGRFRQDLYYRLNVVPLELPPLRERKADIPALAHHFAEQIAAQQGRKLPQLAPSLLAVLMQSDWPGNVRELQNYIERLMALTRGDVLLPDPPPDDMQREGSPRNRPGRARSLRDHVAEIVKRRVLEALERHQGNQSQAARELGLTEQAMRYRLRKYSPSSARRSRRVR
jgi:transcriptional regulator with GAF, ATPase, and Fis domain